MNQKIDFSDFFDKFDNIKISLDYYSDFKKVKENTDKVRMKLEQLNYLIGQRDMRHAIEELWHENPKCFQVLGILIAVRKSQKKVFWGRDRQEHFIYSYFDNVDKILEFIEDSGLINVLQDKQVKNLVDYVFGVEVGLDSHGRKSRSGEMMSSAIAEKFDEAGILYDKEVSSSKMPELKDVLGKDKKKFDFVISTASKKYLIEVNYYSSNGSKVTEIPRSYMDLAHKINSTGKYEFVWITDGKGWEGAKVQLNEAYEEIPELYNLATLGNFIKKISKQNRDNELFLDF